MRLTPEVQSSNVFLKLLKSEKRIRPKRVPKKPSLRFVLSCVSHYYKIPYEILRSKRHNKLITRYRYVALYICKIILNYSYKKINGMFGLAAGTLYRGLNEFENLKLIDPKYEYDLRQIRMQMNVKFGNR